MVSLEDFNQCDRQLKRAEKYFKRANCVWGLGLTYFQQAISLIYRIDQIFSLANGSLISNKRIQTIGSGPLMSQNSVNSGQNSGSAGGYNSARNAA